MHPYVRSGHGLVDSCTSLADTNFTDDVIRLILRRVDGRELCGWGVSTDDASSLDQLLGPIISLTGAFYALFGSCHLIVTLIDGE